MGRFIEAGLKNDVPQGQMKAVKLEGQDILLANIGGSYYAIDNKCPHMGGNLSKGKLESTTVTCPLHGSQFNVTTGKVVRWLKGSGLMFSVGKALKPPAEVKKYNLKVDGDKILVEI
jgi:3-phenylpropionate/trans-cinnamate dioxygenase ferredoxin subunit